MGSWLGLGQCSVWDWQLNSTVENVLKLILVILFQVCECIKGTSVSTSKGWIVPHEDYKNRCQNNDLQPWFLLFLWSGRLWDLVRAVDALCSKCAFDCREESRPLRVKAGWYLVAGKCINYLSLSIKCWFTKLGWFKWVHFWGAHTLCIPARSHTHSFYSI
jgi:hypothetical protein